MSTPPTHTPSTPTRRDLLRSTAVAGLLATPVGGLLSGCAVGGGGGGDTKAAGNGKTSKENPLGVPADQPLDVVIFKGGYSDEYAKFHESVPRPWRGRRTGRSTPTPACWRRRSTTTASPPWT